MAVSADERIGKSVFDGLLSFLLFSRPDRLREIFQVYLMADTGTGRNDAEIGKGLLTPTQERIALAIALELDLDIFPERVARAKIVDHDRVIDHEIDFGERIDLLHFAAELLHGIAHGCKIDHGRNAGEILHENERGPERDLGLGFPLIQPA